MAESNLFPNTDGTLVASVTITKSEGGGSPDNIYDGNPATTDVLSDYPQYWQIDLGSVKNFCKYRIYPTSSAAWQIFASPTGAFAGEEYFLDVLSTSGGGALQRGITINAWNTIYVNPKVSARYVRIVLQGTLNETIGEFEVYEDSVSAFGVFTSDDTDFDGPINSSEEFRRRSLQDNLTTLNPPGSTIALNGGKYFQIDLGSQRNVSKIGTYVHATSTYAIKVSTTGAFAGEEITVIGDTLRTVAQYNDTTNLPYTCRYIRIIASISTYISEITIYEIVPEVKTIFSDTKVLSVVEQDILSDADVYGTVSEDILSDATVVETHEESILSDASVFAPTIRTILSDAMVLSVVSNPIFSDAIVKLVVSEDILSDVTVKVVESEDMLSDAKVIWQWSSNLGSDAIVFVPVDLKCEVKFTKSSLRDLNVETRVIQPTPSIPTGLTAVNAGTGDSVRLEWSGTSPFYNVYRVDPGPTYVKVNNFLVSDNFYVVGGLTEGVTYTFVVRGANGQG